MTDDTADDPAPAWLATSESTEACSLEPADLELRLEEIERLTGRALQRREDDADATVLVFDRDATAEVRDLVRRERQCCAHLDFGIEETDAVVRLTIRARDESFD